MVFQCINIRQVPWEILKTVASGLGFQHLLRYLANVNAWKTMFDPYIISSDKKRMQVYVKQEFLQRDWALKIINPSHAE